MVLGIGEGSLVITLDKYSFLPGDTISGKVQLQLSKPKSARALRVEFYGETVQTRTTYGKDPMHPTRSQETRKINHVTVQAGGAKAYNSGDLIPFSIVVPIDAGKPIGVLGMLFGRAVQPQATWYVHASLDVPMEMDTNARVRVTITDAQGRPV